MFQNKKKVVALSIGLFFCLFLGIFFATKFDFKAGKEVETEEVETKEVETEDEFILFDSREVGPDDVVCWYTAKNGRALVVNIESPDGTVRWRNRWGESGKYNKNDKRVRIWVIQIIDDKSYYSVISLCRYGKPLAYPSGNYDFVFHIDGRAMDGSDVEEVKEEAREEARKQGIFYVKNLDRFLL